MLPFPHAVARSPLHHSDTCFLQDHAPGYLFLCICLLDQSLSRLQDSVKVLGNRTDALEPGEAPLGYKMLLRVDLRPMMLWLFAHGIPGLAMPLINLFEVGSYWEASGGYWEAIGKLSGMLLGIY